MAFLYRWDQAGGAADLRKWIKEVSATDAGFLRLLEACRGWMASDRVYHPLNRRDVEYFMNYNEVMERLRSIGADESQPPSHRRQAFELLEAAKLGDSDRDRD